MNLLFELAAYSDDDLEATALSLLFDPTAHAIVNLLLGSPSRKATRSADAVVPGRKSKTAPPKTAPPKTASIKDEWRPVPGMPDLRANPHGNIERQRHDGTWVGVSLTPDPRPQRQGQLTGSRSGGRRFSPALAVARAFGLVGPEESVKITYRDDDFRNLSPTNLILDGRAPARLRTQG